MSKEAFIKQLAVSPLYAECPKCHEEFMIRDAPIFDGLKSFPSEAIKIQEQLIEELREQEVELRKAKDKVDTGAEQKAYAVGFGKILEKIVPAHKDFKVPLCDCRPLFEPIDIIAFNGLGKGCIDSVTFYEIKTGKSRLNKHEKMVKEAIEAGCVDLKVIR